MDQKQQLLLDATRRLIRRGAFPNLAKLLAKSHPADIAHLFRYLDLKDQRILFNLIGDAASQAVHEELKTQMQQWLRVSQDQGMEPDSDAMIKYFQDYGTQTFSSRRNAIEAMRASVELHFKD